MLPACPLAIDERRKLDERRQRALVRYYLAAGAGGIAVGVHTTQFAVHDPAVGILEPLLGLVSEEFRRSGRPDLVGVAGVMGDTRTACREAGTARELGYDAALVMLSGFPGTTEDDVFRHCAAVAEELPIIGFYLQKSVGGRPLGHAFWRRLFDLDGLVAVKIAPFNRYATLDVVRALCDSGREDVALYTGNDDNIVADLLTPFRFRGPHGDLVEHRMVGGLLGHWSVWTRSAVLLLEQCHAAAGSEGVVPADLLAVGAQVTDANAAVFDATNGFGGCIAGVHEVLRRQGLLRGRWCLDPTEDLGSGQAEQLSRVTAAYPHLVDDDFVHEHLDDWLSG